MERAALFPAAMASIPIEGSEFTTSVDMVIAALGQAPETEFVKEFGISL
ncbi:unnamed protein product, partial [marine sediment metagenome]